MKKILTKAKRTLTLLLALALIVTSLPQTGTLAYAAEQEESVSETNETESGTNAEDGEADIIEMPEESSDETVSQDEFLEEEASSVEADIVEENAETEEYPDNMSLMLLTEDETVSGNSGTEEPPEEETVVFKIAIPYHTDKYHSNKECALSKLEYKIGEGELQTYNVEEDSASEYIEINVPENETLYIRPVLKEPFVMEYVSLSDYDYDYKIDVDEDGFYTCKWTENTDITMSVERQYTFIFDTMNANITMAKLDDGNSVIRDENGDEIWEEVTGAIKSPLANLNKLEFKIQVDEGYILRTISSSSTGIRFSEKVSWGSHTGVYRLVELQGGKRSVGDETKIYVTAEPAEQYEVTFDYPDNISVTVRTREDDGYWGDSVELSSDKKMSVVEGTYVRFSIVTQDSSKGFFVSCTEGGTEKIIEPSIYQFDEDETEYSFSLGALNKGDVSIKISTVATHEVTFETDADTDSGICLRLYSPVSDYLSGSKINGYKALLPDGYELCFKVYRADSEAYQASASIGGKELSPQYDSYWEEDLFKVKPTGNMTVRVNVSAAEFKFDYSEEDIEDIRVYETDRWGEPISEEPLELTENKSILLSDGEHKRLQIEIKPVEGKRIAVTYNESDDWTEELYVTNNTEDGYIVYETIWTYTPSDYKVTIKGYETCNVTFVEEIDSGRIGIKRVCKQDEWWEEWYNEDGAIQIDSESGSCTISSDKGSPVYFAIPHNKSGYKLDYVSTTGNAVGSLPVYEYDEDNERDIYRIIPREDMTVTVKMVKLADYNVKVVTGSEVGKWEICCDDYEELKPNADNVYSVKENSELLIYLDSVKEGYRGTVTYQTGEGELQNADARYYTDIVEIEDEEGNIQKQRVIDVEHYLRITGDTTINIDIEPIDQYTVTFDNAEEFETIKVWDSGSYSDADKYPVTDGKITLNNDKIYYFDIVPKAGKGIERVLASYGTSDSSVVLSKRYDYSEEMRGWLIGKGYGMSQDVTIHADVFDAYTVSFDTSQMDKEERVYSWTEYDSEGDPLDITESEIAVPAAGSYTFFIESENYDVNVDSEAFEMIKSYGDMYGDAYLLYTIAPKQDVKTPSQVTVSFVKKNVQTRVFTLEYPDTVSNIYMASYQDGIYKSLKPDGNNQITVSGSPLVLRVQTIAGNEPTVAIKGDSDAEPVLLDVYRVISGTKEYYIGDVEENKTITVTTERKSDRQKYYNVGFSAEGAAVKEAVCQIPYDTDGYINDPEVGDYLPYSIVQGKSISFFVEPYHGYEIEGVFVGETPITPTQDNTLQKDVYTVTPTQKTLITVKTIKSGSIYDKYNVTFRYPDEVKSVKVQGYELGEDNCLNVPAGTTISFAIELAGENYEVRSVTANKIELPYDQNSGLYTLTTGSEDTEVVILAGSKTPINPDKKHTLTFRYPDEVKSVKVQGYELGEDNCLNVPAGTTISFAIELAGENYEVRSVTANEIELPYDEDSGLYTLTAVSEDTEIVISVGSKTPINPDKKYTVTFIYPDTVKGIIFKDDTYTLENNRISVPDGAKVYFKVDLAEGYEVDTITIGSELKLELENGYHVLTVSGDASCEIETKREEAKAEVTSITIDGVKDGKIEQRISLRREYQITPTPSNGNISGLKAEVTPIDGAQTAPGVTASVNDGMLVIDTTDVIENESAVIKIYDDETEAYVDGGTFTVNVKAPSPDDSFETKLKLGKGTTTIYTGQSKVEVAVAKYSTSTTIQEIATVRDTTALIGDGKALRVWEADNKIYAAATEKAQLGKHTLEVLAYTPGTLERAKAVITVNVVKGIESLEVTVPTTKLYKPADKKTTLKASVIYNSGTTAPKAKKVIYEALDESGKAVSGITVKNGTVTVDKSFTVSDTDTSKNKFRIHVKADDYAENGEKTEAYSDWITLSKDPLEIDSIYILQRDEWEDSYTVVVNENGQKVTTDKLENAIVVAMKKGSTPLEAGKAYTVEELVSAGRIDAALLTYKSSNKALSIHAGGGIEMTKYTSKIKLTLTTADGGKKKKDIQFALEYANPKELQLSIYDTDYNLINGSDSGEKQQTASFAGTANSVLTLHIQEKDNDARWQDIQACVKHTVKVKGGKLLRSDNVRGVYQLVVTGKEATVTLTDMTEKNRPSKQYTITNSDYTTLKAPKVSLKYYNNNDSLTAKSMAPGSLANRKVEFTLINAPSYSYAKLEADSTVTGKLADNTPQYRAYMTLMNAIEDETIAVSGGKFTIKFDRRDIPAGSYKLKLALSGKNGDDFKAETGLINITLKVAKPKAVTGSFKPKASYALKAADGYKADITYTAKNLLKDADGKERYELRLLNANIKGKSNDFLKYFVLDTTGTKPVLKLREGITEEQIAALKTKAQKDNLTGYIAYTAKCGDDGYGKPYTISGSIKIKVTLK